MLRYYKLLPIFLQDIILTLKSCQVFYLKYGSIPFINPLARIIENIEERDFLREKVSDLDNINFLLGEARKNVKYYGRLSNQYRNLDNLNQLEALPILNKDIIRSAANDFRSLKATWWNSYSFKTSGTSGVPIKGKLKITDLRVRHYTLLAAMKTNGIDYSKKVGRFVGAEVASRKCVFRKDLLNHHYYFSIFDISRESIRHYYEAIVNNGIEILEGYPSTIYSLVKLLRETGYVISNVKRVITTAEKLHDFQKEEIEAYFDCIVFDYYGSSEGSVIIYTNTEGYYSVAGNTGFLELIEEKGENNRVSTGKLCRMLVTSYTSSFFPLIRFDIGDMCVIENSSKQKNPKILEILGRSDDIYVTRKGTYFGRFSLCLKYLPGNINASRLMLKNRSNSIRLIYSSPSEIIDKTAFLPFEMKLSSMLCEEFQFSYEFRTKIPEGPNGKLKVVTVSD